MLEEKPEYKKRKKYTKRRQQVIRQLFFTGVAVVVVIIGCATWALKSDNMARKADIQAKTSQTGRKADAAKTSVENGVQANSEAVKEKTDDKDTSDTTKKTETAEERIARGKTGSRLRQDTRRRSLNFWIRIRRRYSLWKIMERRKIRHRLQLWKQKMVIPVCFRRSSNGMKDGDILHTERVLLQ